MRSSRIGVGLYSARSAARLVHVSTQDVSRWLFGYSYKGKDRQPVTQEPLWDRQIEDGLGFLDLIELRFVVELKRRGVSLKSIRRALLNARDIYGMEYPFATQKFQTDGYEVFADVPGESPGDTVLVNMVRRQGVFEEVIAPSLEGVVFDADSGYAARWHPFNNPDVVLDPERAFGQPITTKSGISTTALFKAVQAGDPLSVVADIFEVEQSEVEAAIGFEQGLAA